MIKTSFLLAMSIAILLAYQNCGDVSLAPPVEAPPIASESIESTFCASQTEDGFELQKVYVVNATARLHISTDNIARLYPDSDMDGLLDFEEESYGFDPLNARTNGILDSLCLKKGLVGCSPDPGSCNGDNLATGIQNCDLADDPDFSFKGINSDHDLGDDLIPDFIEIINNTAYDLANANGDLDGDGIINEKEIQIGRNPNNSQDSELPETSNKLMQIERRLLEENSSECQGNALYSLKIDPPLLEVKAFDNGSDLSHEKDENVILIYVVSQNSFGLTEYWLAIKKVPILGASEEDLEVLPGDFKLEASF